MTQLEHLEAIEKRLWQAADTLRANSNYAGNEYFLPVMGLIFLRHAYPTEKDQQVESKALHHLMKDIDTYIGQMIELVRLNPDKTNLRIE